MLKILLEMKSKLFVTVCSDLLNSKLYGPDDYLRELDHVFDTCLSQILSPPNAIETGKCKNLRLEMNAIESKLTFHIHHYCVIPCLHITHILGNKYT
jgi:hypothetical protein